MVGTLEGYQGQTSTRKRRNVNGEQIHETMTPDYTDGQKPECEQMTELATIRSRLVLVAEDDAAMRRLMVQWLEQDGYRTIQCVSGMEIVDNMAFFYPGRPSIDLIISDVRLPEGTGLDALSALRWQQLPPWIIITAFGDNATHRRALELGAAVSLDKPFGVEELMTHVHRLAPLT